MVLQAFVSEVHRYIGVADSLYTLPYHYLVLQSNSPEKTSVSRHRQEVTSTCSDITTWDGRNGSLEFDFSFLALNSDVSFLKE